MKYYRYAEDLVSMVRVLCFKRDFDRASSLVADANPDQVKAASYHLARTYEALESYDLACHWYARSGRLNHAVRLAMKTGKDSEVMRMALVSDKVVMLEAAEYLENRGEYDKSVQLFQNAGAVARSMDLCFEHKLFDLLESIVKDVMSEDNKKSLPPKILSKCAEFFMKHGQYANALEMYVE